MTAGFFLLLLHPALEGERWRLPVILRLYRLYDPRQTRAHILMLTGSDRSGEGLGRRRDTGLLA